VAGNGTFFSDSPDETSPPDAVRRTLLDYRPDKPAQDAAKGPIPSVSKRPPSSENPSADIAPWMDDAVPSFPNHGFNMSSNFFNDGPPKLQLSPSFRPDTGDSDSQDPMFQDERRPSLATSATTESSQTSMSKASTSRGTPYKKVAGLFSDEGRKSSKSSETSLPNTLQREQTASSSRHGSIHASHHSRDDGRPPTSPVGSRPRTPLPSSDVTPWLFQNFKVSSDTCDSVSQQIACLLPSLEISLTDAGRPIGALIQPVSNSEPMVGPRDILEVVQLLGRHMSQCRDCCNFVDYYPVVRLGGLGLKLTYPITATSLYGNPSSQSSISEFEEQSLFGSREDLLTGISIGPFTIRRCPSQAGAFRSRQAAICG